MEEKIRQYLSESESFSAANAAEAEEFRIRFLGRKGILQDLFSELKSAPQERKKELGRLLNELKISAEEKVSSWKENHESAGSAGDPGLDLTRPGEPLELGARHPLSLIRSRIIEIFSQIGYSVAEGPEIEDDWHNFSALNFPGNHPARDMQDTFFIAGDPAFLLRTHTSNVQVRVMESTTPPISILAPGRVYRNEAISARANCFFHQVEGLFIDEDVSFADMKQTLLYFVREMFGKETKIRLRPSYFPFTEPSAEMDMSCNICSGKGCPVCKHSGWVEIMGCGMVDPQVLINCKIDPEKYSGFAFGMGIERIAMLKYRINDLRVFFDNDARFLRQFTGEI